MIRPTLRGVGLVLVVLVAAGLAWLFGDRALNAVAAPALVALAAGVVQMAVASDPTVERGPVEPGFPGETRTVALDIEGGSTVVDVRDAIGEGFEADGNDGSVAPPATMTYDLEYLRRGEHDLGPTTVRVRDVLGLFERTVTVDTAASVVVYPEVYTLGGGGDLSRLLAEALNAEREEFDSLREYAPGDSLRDVDWKATAKRPEDLMVTEFSGRESEGSVTIATSATAGAIDLATAATASIAIALREAGVHVDIYAPDGDVSTTDDRSDQHAMLGLLARTGDGQVADEVWAGADVHVSGSSRDVTVTVDGRTSSFWQWCNGHANPLTDEPASSRGVRAA
ncbi:DUF58 domain-containing protein [Halapricum salinum]|uniref:DUF58 domain-containing protein n=1 Tax=Halapricum salinum TaxID=1457250 RepID=A0A4D6HFS0_9EURY|nr:DUF58 domain-containing protein [Halapricum salinum]QCC51627.1 DUF58 domain-containing protein [Halapricum salinum]